jgi:hypothetical protein
MAKITIYGPQASPTLFPDANRVEVREGILTFYVHEGDPRSNQGTKYSTNLPFLAEETIGISGL